MLRGFRVGRREAVLLLVELLHEDLDQAALRNELLREADEYLTNGISQFLAHLRRPLGLGARHKSRESASQTS